MNTNWPNIQPLYNDDPLSDLIGDDTISEIIVNNPESIFYEKNGQLIWHDKKLFTKDSYINYIEKICQMNATFLSVEKPFVEAQIDNLRYTIVLGELSKGYHLLSIRKQPKTKYTLNNLIEKNWCTKDQLNILKVAIRSKKNMLIVGGTSSGKTTALQAIISECSELERFIIIEDTQEIQLPNSTSASLLTMHSSIDEKKSITMSDLLKRALRLRPDRLIIGEIRGAEATQLLMALSTGHNGSIGTLHAKNQNEALLRLEMLIQMGAPQWSIDSIRRLIALTIDMIIVVERTTSGRQLQGIYQLETIEKTGFTFNRLDESYF